MITPEQFKINFNKERQELAEKSAKIILDACEAALNKNKKDILIKVSRWPTSADEMTGAAYDLAFPLVNEKLKEYGWILEDISDHTHSFLPFDQMYNQAQLKELKK